MSNKWCSLLLKEVFYLQLDGIAMSHGVMSEWVNVMEPFVILV